MPQVSSHQTGPNICPSSGPQFTDALPVGLEWATMDIDRRSFLNGIGSLGLTGLRGPDRKPPTTGSTDLSVTSRWHPLARSLLDRAMGGRSDPSRVERTVRE